MILIPGLPLRLMRAGVGAFNPDTGSWRTVRHDLILTGPGGFRSILRVRIWSWGAK